MPVKIPNTLPARTTLEHENIFVMDEERAIHQDIRALRVAILNLMPTKVATETQLLRLLSNSALQVEVTLLHTATYESRNTDAEHLLQHYVTFEDIEKEKFDGFIVTGAPVEQMPFEEVEYWDELTHIMDWAETNVESTFYICWGAQAGLYHRYVDSTTFSSPHTPATRRFAEETLKRLTRFNCWLNPTKPVYISSARRMDANCISRVTKNMI